MSVVIPSYDDAVVLDLTLRSLAEDGSGRDSLLWEVIVVDDGSTDDTDAVLARPWDVPLVVVRQGNRGRAASRNAGAARASGEVLVFCDADRAVGPGFLDAHARTSDAVALGDIREVYVTNLVARRDEMAAAIADGWAPFSRRWRRPAFVATVLDQFVDGEASGPFRWLSFLSGNVSLPTDLFWAAGGFDERFTTWGFEHFELGYRLATHGARFVHNDAPSYHFAHRRPEGFYDDAIAASAEVFRALHPEAPVDDLVALVTGRRSLDELVRDAAI